MVFGRMMLDHPGWVQAGDGVVHRAVTDGHHTTIVTDTRVAEVWLRVGSSIQPRSPVPMTCWSD